jgi:hypothetical protein
VLGARAPFRRSVGGGRVVSCRVALGVAWRGVRAGRAAQRCSGGRACRDLDHACHQCRPSFVGGRRWAWAAARRARRNVHRHGHGHDAAGAEQAVQLYVRRVRRVARAGFRGAGPSAVTTVPDNVWLHITRPLCKHGFVSNTNVKLQA